MAQICIGVVVAVSADAADTECVDLKAMSAGELSSRNSLHWSAMSTQADKSCAKCNFFSATSGGCGSCVILGGATDATGYCDSWTTKDS
jgi:sulfatase maturation enzyme AslB (radical SAM superfamily)